MADKKQRIVYLGTPQFAVKPLFALVRAGYQIPLVVTQPPRPQGRKGQLTLTPVQQFAYTSGKNATDMAMVIDAMDILYSGNVDGFCIVSSDSDFTRLATRLREAGMKVYGMGEKKTPKPFIVACDKFVYIESLKAAEKPQPPAPAGKSAKKKAPVPAESSDLSVQELIAQSVEDLADEDGYAYLGDLGTLLIKKQPDFDARNYGFAKLSKFIAALDGFEIDERHNAKYQGTQVFVRNKK